MTEVRVTPTPFPMTAYLRAGKATGQGATRVLWQALCDTRWSRIQRNVTFHPWSSEFMEGTLKLLSHWNTKTKLRTCAGILPENNHSLPGDVHGEAWHWKAWTCPSNWSKILGEFRSCAPRQSFKHDKNYVSWIRKFSMLARPVTGCIQQCVYVKNDRNYVLEVCTYSRWNLGKSLAYWTVQHQFFLEMSWIPQW